MRATWQELEDYLGDFASALCEPPLAMVVISGHWEESVPTVNISAAPPLLFDYHGFLTTRMKLRGLRRGRPSSPRMCAHC